MQDKWGTTYSPNNKNTKIVYKSLTWVEFNKSYIAYHFWRNDIQLTRPVQGNQSDTASFFSKNNLTKQLEYITAPIQSFWKAFSCVGAKWKKIQATDKKKWWRGKEHLSYSWLLKIIEFYIPYGRSSACRPYLFIWVYQVLCHLNQ